MADFVESISSDLRKNYKVDEHFYPKISMDIDLPNGLEGEVSEIVRILQKNNFQVTSGNVFRIMELKKELLAKYSETTEGKNAVTRYRRILFEKVRPIGITIPIEFILVNGIITVLLYMLARFAGSFADESGKIAARKLLENDKERSRELKMTTEEYQFLKNEGIIIIQEGETISSLQKKLKKQRLHKKRQPR
jgi:hypothetical protein